MLPSGYIAHQTGDRLRLRVPSRKGDAAYFAHVEQALMGCEGVTYIEANPLTASILVRYDGTTEELSQEALTQGLFALDLEPRPANPVLSAVSARMDQFDGILRRTSGGSFDLLEVAFVGLIGASIVQALRGQVLSPASTLLTNAMSILALYRARQTDR